MVEKLKEFWNGLEPQKKTIVLYIILGLLIALIIFVIAFGLFGGKDKPANSDKQSESMINTEVIGTESILQNETETEVAIETETEEVVANLAKEELEAEINNIKAKYEEKISKFIIGIDIMCICYGLW